MADFGYGGFEYGRSPYGASPSPYIYVVNIDGYSIEVVFPDEMEINPALTDVLSYNFTPVLGAATSNAILISIGSFGVTGANSVIISHSGTTMGGIYTMVVTGLTDIAGVPIEIGGRNITNFLAVGEAPSCTVTPISGNQLSLQFVEDLINTPDASNPLSYLITSLYPVPVTVSGATFPYLSNNTVLLDVIGMTSVNYDILIGPSESINYDGSYLPNTSLDFNGIEIGTGASSISGSSLRINKNAGDIYGWDFEDTAGKMVLGSSFRADITIDNSTTIFNPVIFDTTFGAYSVSDGTTQVDVFLERVAGVELITVSSGGFLRSVNYNWSIGQSKISVIRNQQAVTFTVLLDDSPVITDLIPSFSGGATMTPGLQFILSNNYTITGFRILSAMIDATSTIYSVSWNFIHSSVSSFIGSALLTRKKILTENGPLVKSWGDNTPATFNDVAVRVNGIDVTVVDVNPYLGEIEVDIPIPFTPPGTVTVDVDYCWIPSPTLEIGSLNTDGSNLNVWSNPSGISYPTVPGSLGAIDQETRFQMRLVLGPVDRPQPLTRSPRYFGFEKEYSSVLNDGTSLLLNQNPNSTSIQRFEYEPKSETYVYDGTSLPSNDWDLVGVDYGYLNDDLGTYTLVDGISGRYPVDSKAFYSREIDSSSDAFVYLSTRFMVNSYTLDGVYTGIGFGLHNNKRWYVVCLLEVNGVKHIGYPNNLAEPELVSSWDVGPSVTINIESSTTCSMGTSLVPVSLESGDRFQIIDGLQAGIYTVDVINKRRDGTTEISITTTFPTSNELWGASTALASFETLWDVNPFSYRMVVDTKSGSSTSYISGEISSSIGTLTGAGINPPYPAQSPFFFLTDTDLGQVFWGSLGGVQENISTWSFVRYAVAPFSANVYTNEVIVSSDMSSLPQEDSNSEWYLSQGAGYSEVTGTGLLLKTTYNLNNETFFEYKRVEPFLNNQLCCDVDVRFRVESDCSGFGDAAVVIRDTKREVRFGTLIYFNSVDGPRMVSAPTVSMSGKSNNPGWSVPSGVSLTRTDSYWHIAKTSSPVGGFFYDELDFSTYPSVDKGARVLEARFAVESYVADSFGNTGIAVLAEAGVPASPWPPRIVGITPLTSPFRIALTSSGTVIQSYTFDWDDGGIHTYRVLMDAVSDSVVVVIDDVVQVPTASFLAFDLSASNVGTFFGSFDGSFSSLVKYESVSCKSGVSATLENTYGIYIGGDKDDIDSYVIPRSDGLDVPNSDSLAVIVDYDWTNFSDIRVHFDPTWGVSIFDPTIPPPPYSNIYDPTSAIISVEYQNLPILEENFGSISWGSIGDSSVDPSYGSISQSRWSYVRYHVFMYNNGESTQTPQRMVLNSYNILNSGELTKDGTPETRTIVSFSSTKVKVSDCGITADNILIVSVDGYTLPRVFWSFDKESQEITFSAPLSQENKPVTVVFEPGLPVTYTYLLEQPLWEGVVILNEGTPVEQLNQSGGYSYITAPGSLITGRNSDFIDNTPYLYMEDVSSSETKFTDLSIIDVTDDGETGLLSFACDNNFAGHGLLSIGFDGSPYYDTFQFAGEWFIGSGGSLISAPITSPPYPILLMSGGTFTDGTIGPGTSILYPNYGGNKYNPVGINQLVMFYFVLDGNTDSFTFLDELADNVPPSYTTDLSLVPDGSAGINEGGACLAVLETPGLYTVIGSFGGLDYLSERSLLAGVSVDQSIGIPSSGFAFTLVGGSVLQSPTLEIYDPLEVDVYRLPPLSNSATTGTFSVTTGAGGKSFSIPAWATGMMVQVNGADVYYRAGAVGLTIADIDTTGESTDSVWLDGLVASFRIVAGQEVLVMITASGTATVVLTPFVD